ncbi:MAG TPA: hypothetical protein VGE02_03670 [Gemmatimonadales bacterium]
MQLQVYVRHPDETSMFIDAVSDQDEAITLCHDLVVVDGYERAEVWSEDGERLYCIERREGAVLNTLDDLDRSTPIRLRTPADSPGGADEGDAEPPAPPPVILPPARRELPGELPRILGEQPGHEERWLGL